MCCCVLLTCFRVEATSTFAKSSLEENFLCPSLVSIYNPYMSVQFDPSYYSHSLCSCERGTFGTAPVCQSIPESQQIGTKQFIYFNEFNDTFTDAW